MSNEAKLGTFPQGDEGRDAVHVAIMTARAGMLLHAGRPVFITGSGDAIECAQSDAIGVADPFLRGETMIYPGDWFWLCLYPGTTKNLRHVWEHASIPNEEKIVEPLDEEVGTSCSC